MPRNIFIVDSYLVDASGTFSHFQGFPQSFDSRNYEDSVDTALRRATSVFAAQLSTMNSAAGDTRQIQQVTMTDIYGFQIDKKCVGQLQEEEETETTEE